MIRLKHLLTETTIDTAVQWAKTFQADLGLTPEAASAMAANIQHESGFIADRVQGTGVQRGTLKDAGKLGYSWAQWTHDTRKTKFKDFVKFNFKTDITKTPALSKHAYAFLKYDVQTYKELKFDFNLFKKSKDIDAATEDFVTKYEGAGTPRLEKRQATAREILNKIKPKSKQTNNINKSVTHIVKSGDTLSELAAKYKITVQQLKQINGLTSDNIKIGQKLYVQLTKPVPTPPKQTVPTPPKQTIKDNPWDDMF